jgi:signal transduction histidine kinase
MPTTFEVNLRHAGGSSPLVNEPHAAGSEAGDSWTDSEFTTTAKPSQLLELHNIWRVSDAISLRKTIHVTDIPAAYIEGFEIRGWGELAREAVVIPIMSEDLGQDFPTVILIIGLNSRRPYDEDYATWFDVMRVSLGALFTSVMSKEAEHKRAEQLSQLDAAKTLFFSNASHELRLSPHSPPWRRLPNVDAVARNPTYPYFWTIARRN